MQWIVSEDKLGGDQKDVIAEIGKITNKPIWIKGHAGSGKSVLLLHALKDYLARKPSSNVCVVVFTRALVDLLSTGLKQIPFLENKSIPVLTIYEMNNSLRAGKKFDAIFCDEIQDVPISMILQMKNACTHLIIAGDAEQSIYNKVPGLDLKPATSSEILSQIIPLEKNLTIIYRLTASVLNVLRNVFRTLLSDKTNIAKEDTEIKLYKASTIDEEIQFCWKEAKQTNSLRSADVSAILISGHDAIVDFVNKILKIEGKNTWTRVNGNLNTSPDYNSLNRHLANANVPLMYVGNNYGSLAEADRTNKIIIMTYHSSKGLDFNYVYLPMVNSSMFIHSNVNALLLVALSRSKSGLFISFTGSLYPALNSFLTGLKPKSIELTNAEDEIIF
jgi:superfamily I DNA/RNA helicase